MVKNRDTRKQSHIEVIGARVHNLKGIDVRIPRGKMTVITGISGSGKSSLAFDVIYAEGQRRYMETFSHYARRFIGRFERPEVEEIRGLSPVISIEQKSVGWNPRSTVGTVTEVYDFFRLLYARTAEAYSYKSGKRMVKFTEDQLVDYIVEQYGGEEIIVLAPVVVGRRGHYRELFDSLRKQGFVRVRVDGEMRDIERGMQLDRYRIHDIDVYIDRLSVRRERVERLRHAVRLAFKMGEGFIRVLQVNTGQIRAYSKKLMDPETGLSYEIPSPFSFSFNSPYGWCPSCKGLGRVKVVDVQKLIPDPSKSIRRGGIVPLKEWKGSFLLSQIEEIAGEYGFDMDTPIADIPEEALRLILYGRGKEGSQLYTLRDEGLVQMLMRIYESNPTERIKAYLEDFMSEMDCAECEGYRIKKVAQWFRIDGWHIGQISMWPLHDLRAWVEGLEAKLGEDQLRIAREVLREIKVRLQFLLDVGLEYLHLHRPARTLSGGESQRIRLATQIGSRLSGITYILDEPSIGLHQRDNRRLISSLRALVDQGNTVIVVEHDRDIMERADWIVDMGPGAGVHGGEVVGEGPVEEFVKQDTLTAAYLSGRARIPIPPQRRQGTGKELVLYGARGHNLKSVDLRLPLGKIICVTGVSGSGKSSLITETLYPLLRQHLHKSVEKPLPYDRVEGLEYIGKVIEVDQSPIGRTPRSSPALYVKVFDEIRQLFSKLPESRMRGYKPGRFSFNVKGGRCEHCQGAGVRIIEMHFLPDVLVECEYCGGKRYNEETLQVRYKGKNISDVLNMTVEEACRFFENIPSIHRKLQTLQEVGLGYIRLGQPATTLSGGEAQRVKLSKELARVSKGNTLYILDEPTTGLHFEDIMHLLHVLNKLADRGNTVVIIEHNMDVIKSADWIIDLGPEGGERGGTIIAQGTPEEIIRKGIGYTAKYLKEVFEKEGVLESVDEK